MPSHITLPDPTLLNTHHSCMLMFGRRATLPIDVELERQCSEDLCKTYWELEEHPYPAAFSGHACILEEAKGNIIAAKLRQKEAYDKKHHKPSV